MSTVTLPLPNMKKVYECLRESLPDCVSFSYTRQERNVVLISCELSNGSTESIFFKFGHPGDKRVEKEILLYQTLLSSKPAHAPLLVASRLEQDQAWLLLKSIGDEYSDLDPQSEPACKFVFENIARMHAHFESMVADILQEQNIEPLSLWDSFKDGRGNRHSRHFLAVDFEKLAQQGVKIIEDQPEMADRYGFDKSRIDRLLACQDQILDEILAGPVSFLHGDLHQWNILVSEDSSNLDYYLIDWGFSGIGMRQLDLGYIFIDGPKDLCPLDKPPTILYGKTAEVCLKAYWSEINKCSDYRQSWTEFERNQRLVNLYHALGQCTYVLGRKKERPLALCLFLYAWELSKRLELI
jgi:hypothetical protein